MSAGSAAPLCVNDLPEELLGAIFSWLHPKFLFKAAETCKKWRSACRNMPVRYVAISRALRERCQSMLSSLRRMHLQSSCSSC